MNTRHARPVTLIGLGMIVIALVALVTLGLPGAVVYYLTPTELSARPTDGPVRLYGIVEPGSVRWQEATKELRFVVTDGTTAISVRTQAIPTAIFREGVAVVLAGRRDAPSSFVADELLVKHSEVYAPLEPGQTIPPGLIDSLAGDSP